MDITWISNKEPRETDNEGIEFLVSNQREKKLKARQTASQKKATVLEVFYPKSTLTKKAVSNKCVASRKKSVKYMVPPRHTPAIPYRYTSYEQAPTYYRPTAIQQFVSPGNMYHHRVSPPHAYVPVAYTTYVPVVSTTYVPVARTTQRNVLNPYVHNQQQGQTKRADHAGHVKY